MSTHDFLEHVASLSRPEPSWFPALRGLWYAEKGEWERAHDCCQEGDEREGAWVHAHLHREEGDLSNARYGYHRAGKPESTSSLSDERRSIINTFLSD